jgi:hypothetical protein
MRLNPEQQHELDCRSGTATPWPSEYHPYQWQGPFCYSLRCQLCRDEVSHTWEQHDALRFSWDNEDGSL